MKIAVYGRVAKPENLGYIKQLFELLQERKLEVILCEHYREQLVGKVDVPEGWTTLGRQESIGGRADLLISMGGDGTLLDTVTIVRDSEVPVVGINMGRLGFLASISKDQLGLAVEAICNNAYVVDKRSLIHLDSNSNIFGAWPYALNEFTIHKRDSSAMIIIRTYINGEFMIAYWADGLIVATPTGSTAYSLSCGGPIIFPSSENFVITPVAPHNLNVRPIVVSEDAVISFEVEGRSEKFLTTLDSRFETIDSSVQLAVRKEKFNFSLVRLDEINFLTTMRNKLMLGIDTRNRS